MEKKRSRRSLLGWGVWAFSMLIGAIITYLMVFVWLETDMARFQLKYFLLITFSIGIILVIWLDYFLDTKILPE
jgi:hypothetical protein